MEETSWGNHVIPGNLSSANVYVTVNSEDKKVGPSLGLHPLAGAHWIDNSVMCLHCSPDLVLARTAVCNDVFPSLFRCPGEVSLCLLWEKLRGQQVYSR